jgi:hypothetical protein
MASALEAPRFRGFPGKDTRNPYTLLVFALVRRPGLSPLARRKSYITPLGLETSRLLKVPCSRFCTNIS